MEITGGPGLREAGRERVVRAWPAGGGDWEGGQGLAPGLLVAERQMQRQKGVNTRGLRQELRAIPCGCLRCMRSRWCRMAGGLARHAKGLDSNLRQERATERF